jgi:hypothetical protein
MDITSPFFVVPVLAITFLACILFATLTDKQRFDETLPDDSNAKTDSH